MSQLTFKYSHARELEILDYCKQRFPKEDWSKYDVSTPLSDSEVEKRIALIQLEWEKREEKYLKKLNEFFGSNFTLSGVTAYLCRIPRYPYELDWFAIPDQDVNQQLTLIVHESMHLAFHQNWEAKCMEIFKSTKNPQGLVYSLKEALPELTSTKFREFKGEGVFDKGKNDSGEQLLRLMLRNYYRKHKIFKFEDFLDEFQA